MKAIIHFFAGLLLSFEACSVPIEKVLDVSVNILVSQNGGQLEIVAPKSSFLAKYSQDRKSFDSLDIPFYVRSVGGGAVNYTLALDSLIGRCNVDEIFLRVELDGVDIDVNQTRQAAGVENRHQLLIKFPEIEQKGVALLCEGHVGIIAEIIL